MKKQTLLCMLLLAGGLVGFQTQASIVTVQNFEGSISNWINGNSWLISTATNNITAYTGNQSLQMLCNYAVVTGHDNWQFSDNFAFPDGNYTGSLGIPCLEYFFCAHSVA